MFFDFKIFGLFSNTAKIEVTVLKETFAFIIKYNSSDCRLIVSIPSHLSSSMNTHNEIHTDTLQLCTSVMCYSELNGLYSTHKCSHALSDASTGGRERIERC